jgi:hypothetical protein
MLRGAEAGCKALDAAKTCLTVIHAAGEPAGMLRGLG